MTKSVSLRSVMTSVYSQLKDRVFDSYASNFLPLVPVLFSYAPRSSSTFCQPVGKVVEDGFRITVGGSTLFSIVGQDGKVNSYYDTIRVDEAELLSLVREAVSGCKALVLHEFGHLIFTNMLDTQLQKYPNKNLVGAIHTVFNIFEDIVIERFGMSKKYPWTKKYFQFLESKLFIPHASEYKDEEDADSFIQYLLMMLRCGYSNVPHNKVYEDNREFLSEKVKDILLTKMSSDRLTKVISLVEWLENNTSLTFSCVSEPPKSSTTPSGGLSSSSKSSTGSSVSSGSGDDGTGETGEGDFDDSFDVGTSPSKTTINKESGYSSSGSFSAHDGRDAGSSCVGGGTHISSGSSIDVTSIQSAEELGEDPTDPGSYIYDDKNDLLIDEIDIVHESFNDILMNLESHQFIKASEYFVPSKNTLSKLDVRLASVNDLCFESAQSFKILQSRSKPHYQRGYTSGKVHIGSLVNSKARGVPDLKIFQRKTGEVKQPDVAISILCDNSGSMSGNKAYVATNAMLALAQACDLCNIPLEVACFTNGGGFNWTISMKAFNESFDSAKQFFGIADSDILNSYNYDRRRLPMFCSNEDESNIYHVWQGLLKNPHDKKVLIVISDGETCGSTSGLKKLISQIEESGISVIGLGIQSTAVANAYSRYKLFDTVDSLNALPDFLVDTLFEIASAN